MRDRKKKRDGDGAPDGGADSPEEESEESEASTPSNASNAAPASRLETSIQIGEAGKWRFNSD